jgi:hypothetical protein
MWHSCTEEEVHRLIEEAVAETAVAPAEVTSHDER